MALSPKKILDLADFPIGTRVITPLGLMGVVIRHSHYGSKQDLFNRLTIRYEPDREGGSEQVQLQPSLVRKII